MSMNAESFDLSDIVAELERIISALINTKKFDTAKFFEEKLRAIIDSKDYLSAIDDLSKCRVMAQYGNFTYQEEEMLSKICRLAIEIRGVSR